MSIGQGREIKECPECHGKGYITVIKPKDQWKGFPYRYKPESEQIFCACRLRTGLSKEQVKMLREM